MEILSQGTTSFPLPSFRRRTEKYSLFVSRIASLSPVRSEFLLRIGAGPETVREEECTGKEGS